MTDYVFVLSSGEEVPVEIKETFDKKIIISPKCKITINIRHLSGNVNTLFYNIKNIITDNTLNSENKILKDND